MMLLCLFWVSAVLLITPASGTNWIPASAEFGSSSHLQHVVQFFQNLYVGEDVNCLEAYTGVESLMETARPKLVVGSNLDLDLDVGNKCYFLIASQEEGLEKFSIRGYKPTIIFIQDHHLNSIKQQEAIPEGIPVVHYSGTSHRILFRNEHGLEFEGIWSKRSSSVIFKGVNDHATIHGHQNKILRIAYNNKPPIFFYANETQKLDGNSMEGAILEAYIAKRNLTPEYIWGGHKWGSLDSTTNIWNGVVGKVGYEKADIATTHITITMARSTFVAYTMYVGEDVCHWVSKYPGKISPSQNIFNVFDIPTWIAILISLFSVSLGLLLIVKADILDTNNKPDSILVLIVSLGILNAENMPTWFKNKKNKMVFSGSLILLVWSLASTILVFAFSCNLRSSLLKPNYESPIDSAVDIVKNKRTVEIEIGGFWSNYFGTSTNALHSELFEEIVESQSLQAEDMITKDLIRLVPRVWVWGVSKENKVISSLPKPALYISKEKVRPYYRGWPIRKESIWLDDINLHILMCHQAGFNGRIVSLFEGGGSRVTDTNLEKMGAEHVLIPFIVLGVGLVLATLGFAGEKIYKKDY